MNLKNKYDKLLSSSSELEYKNGFDKLFDIKSDPKYKSLVESSFNYLTIALSTPGFESELSRHLAERYNLNTNVYDKAIDAVYNQTHIGGPMLHHNLDGNHTWVGAIQALQESFPNDSDFQNAYHTLVHLAKDMTTPSGINPFLTQSDFLQYKEFFVSDFNIPKSVVNDLLNINAIELCGAVTATIALLYDFNEIQMDRLGQYTGRLSLSSYLAGNPALILVTAICLGRICYGLWKGESMKELLSGVIQGALSAGSFFCVAACFPSSIFVGLIVAVTACFGINWFYKRFTKSLKNSLDKILESQFSNYRSYYGLIIQT